MQFRLKANGNERNLPTMDSFLTDVQIFGIPAPAALVLAFMAIVAGGWIICPVLVLFSGRSYGGAKFGWFIVTLLFAWLGYAIFLILTQKPREREAAKITNRIEPRL